MLQFFLSAVKQVYCLQWQQQSEARSFRERHWDYSPCAAAAAVKEADFPELPKSRWPNPHCFSGLRFEIWSLGKFYVNISLHLSEWFTVFFQQGKFPLKEAILSAKGMDIALELKPIFTEWLSLTTAMKLNYK